MGRCCSAVLRLSPPVFLSLSAIKWNFTKVGAVLPSSGLCVGQTFSFEVGGRSPAIWALCWAVWEQLCRVQLCYRAVPAPEQSPVLLSRSHAAAGLAHLAPASLPQFLINREGQVVKRYSPMEDPYVSAACTLPDPQPQLRHVLRAVMLSR